MSEQDTTVSVDVSAPVSEEAVDKYFESNGEVPIETVIGASANEGESHTEEKAETKQEKVVPHGALHEERQRRKELQAKNTELQERMNRNEAVLQQILQRNAQPPPPSFNEDPLEALRHDTELLKQAQMQQIMQQNQANQTQMQQQAYNQFVSRYRDSAMAYEKDAPDFKDAYQYLTKSRLAEYSAAGYSKEQAERLLVEDEAAVVVRAYEDDVNPAERIYALAKIRGFAGKQSPGDKLGQIEKGMKSTKSLSSAGGKTSKEDLTLDALAQLPPDELEEVLAKKWDKIMKLG